MDQDFISSQVERQDAAVPSPVEAKSRFYEILTELSETAIQNGGQSLLPQEIPGAKRIRVRRIGGVELSLFERHQFELGQRGICDLMQDVRRVVSLNGRPLHRRIGALLGLPDACFQGDDPGGILIPTFKPNAGPDHSGMDLALYPNRPWRDESGQWVTKVHPIGRKKPDYLDVPFYAEELLRYHWKTDTPTVLWVQDSKSADAIISMADVAISTNGVVADTDQLRQMLEETGIYDLLQGCFHIFVFNANWREADGFFQTIHRLIGLIDPDGWHTRMLHLDGGSSGEVKTVADEIGEGMTPDDFIWDAMPYNLHCIERYV